MFFNCQLLYTDVNEKSLVIMAGCFRLLILMICTAEKNIHYVLKKKLFASLLTTTTAAKKKQNKQCKRERIELH